MIIPVLVLALAAVADSAALATATDSTSAPDSIAVPVARGSVLLLPEVRVDRERALTEVLGEAAGVHVDQYGGLGAFSTVSLRGAAAGQVTIYLDGVPLTSAAHGEVNLADLPITAVERVEIYRGLAPLALGAATPGGAVNLVTTPVAGTPGVRELRVARGSFGTWEARGTAGARRGALAAMLHAGYQGSAGDFRYFDDNGT